LETTEITRHYLKRMFGDAVEMSYHDVADVRTAEALPALVAKAEEEGAYYPVVFVDGELMISGSAEFYHVLSAVQEVLQPRNASTPAV